MEEIKPSPTNVDVQPGWIYTSKGFFSPKQSFKSEILDTNSEPNVKLLEVQESEINSLFNNNPYERLWRNDIKDKSNIENFKLFVCSTIETKSLISVDDKENDNNYEYASTVHYGYSLSFMVIYKNYKVPSTDDIKSLFYDLFNNKTNLHYMPVTRINVYHLSEMRTHKNLKMALKYVINDIKNAKKSNDLIAILCQVKKLSSSVQNKSKEYCIVPVPDTSYFSQFKNFVKGKNFTGNAKNLAFYNKDILSLPLDGVSNQQQRVETRSLTLQKRNLQSSIKINSENNSQMTMMKKTNIHDPFEVKSDMSLDFGHASSVNKQYLPVYVDSQSVQKNKSSEDEYANVKVGQTAVNNNLVSEVTVPAATNMTNVLKAVNSNENLKIDYSDEGNKESNIIQNLKEIKTTERKVESMNMSKTSNKLSLSEVTVPVTTNMLKAVNSKENLKIDNGGKGNKKSNKIHNLKETKTTEKKLETTNLSKKSLKKESFIKLQIPNPEKKGRFLCKSFMTRKGIDESSLPEKCFFLIGSDVNGQSYFINLIWKYLCDETKIDFSPVIDSQKLTKNISLYKFLNFEESSVNVTIVMTPALTEETIDDLKSLLKEGFLDIHGLGLILNAQSSVLSSIEFNIIHFLKSLFGEVLNHHLVAIIMNCDLNRNIPALEEVRNIGIKPTCSITINKFLEFFHEDDLSKILMKSNLRNAKKSMKMVMKFSQIFIKISKLAQERSFAKVLLENSEQMLREKMADFAKSYSVEIGEKTSNDEVKEIWTLMKLVFTMKEKDPTEDKLITFCRNLFDVIGICDQIGNNIFLYLILLDDNRNFTVIIKSILDWHWEAFECFYSEMLESNLANVIELTESQSIPLYCQKCNDIHNSERKFTKNTTDKMFFKCKDCICSPHAHSLWIPKQSNNLSESFARKAQKSLFDAYSKLGLVNGLSKSDFLLALANIFPQFNSLLK